MRILNVVGARPNLVKIAPLLEEMRLHTEIRAELLHTGQHYAGNLSRVFFDDLGIPHPDIHLGIGSGSHAEQTGRVMMEFEKVLLANRPDLVLVVGDVNSTLACAVTAAKLWIPVAHVEAGLRSFDRRMPEEINRIVTDALADLLFTTSRDAGENLRREGIAPEKVFFAGNVMIDTLERHRSYAERLGTPARLGMEEGRYALLTLHRPSNVDAPDVLAGILDAVDAIQATLPVVFPAHPRTVHGLDQFGLAGRLSSMPNLRITEPLGYLEFLDLMMHAKLVLTDSGGIQEETTILKVPCLTLRVTTERPITVTQGTNVLVGTDAGRIVAEAQRVLAGRAKSGRMPELWDGKAARRIVKILLEKLG